MKVEAEAEVVVGEKDNVKKHSLSHQKCRILSKTLMLQLLTIKKVEGKNHLSLS